MESFDRPGLDGKAHSEGKHAPEPNQFSVLGDKSNTPATGYQHVCSQRVNTGRLNSTGRGGLFQGVFEKALRAALSPRGRRYSRGQAGVSARAEASPPDGRGKQSDLKGSHRAWRLRPFQVDSFFLTQPGAALTRRSLAPGSSPALSGLRRVLPNTPYSARAKARRR